ncbi:amidohydrolase family protein [Streptomyces sp. NPDC005262]|uniref:amidohydrolase family protein n=1 Tax=Streptomyces sp. NPDC005262 TaxID=3364710 RepID=UPI0036AABCB6
MHAHLWTPGYLDRLERLGKTDTDTQRGIGADATEADLDRRFALMDRAGIDLQVLSVAPQSPHLMGEPDAVALAASANESYAELVARFPGRFRAFAALPLPHVDAALREVVHALDDLGAVGVGVTTTVLGRTLADPLFDPLYEELDRRGAVRLVDQATPDDVPGRRGVRVAGGRRNARHGGGRTPRSRLGFKVRPSVVVAHAATRVAPAGLTPAADS